MPWTDFPVKGATSFGHDDDIALGAPSRERLVGEAVGKGEHGEVISSKRVLNHRVQVFVAEPVWIRRNRPLP